MNGESPSKAWLEAANGEQIPIDGTCYVGRSNGNHLVLADDRVSRKHAMIHAQGADEYWLVDLGSSNGSYVQGRRVGQPCQLNDQDVVEIGSSKFVFHHPNAVADPTTARTTETGQTIQDVRSVQCWLLVADMEGSTEFIKKLPPEKAPMVTGKWLSACKDIIEKHGGSLNKFLGDGFFAFWIDRDETLKPVSDALRALRNLQQEQAPRFRIVLHYGKVFIGGPSMGEDSLVGNEVNFVFRIEKVAGTMGLSTMFSEPASQKLQPLVPSKSAGNRTVPSFDGEFAFFEPEL